MNRIKTNGIYQPAPRGFTTDMVESNTPNDHNRHVPNLPYAFGKAFVSPPRVNENGKISVPYRFGSRRGVYDFKTWEEAEVYVRQNILVDKTNNDS